MELLPAQDNVTEVQVAKSGQYLLFTSGLSLGWFGLGVEVTAGMQEAESTGIYWGNGRHPARAEEKVLFLLLSHFPSLPAPIQHHGKQAR